MTHTLLLADDSVTIQRVIELTFADQDVTVVAVSDGDQAIERLEAAPPDIVLADIGMPGKDGYEVAQYIRRSPRLSHIPVVLLTGAFEPVDQARANEAGCDGVLAKPFEPQLVIGRVKELLARPRVASAPAAEVKSSSHDTPRFPQPAPTPGADTLWSRGAGTSADESVALPGAELNDYFDRLDAAFSTLPGEPGASTAPWQRDAGGASEAVTSNDATELDWFGNAAAEPPNREQTGPLGAAAATDHHPEHDLELSYDSFQPESRYDLLVPEPSPERQPEMRAEMVSRDADERLSPIEESVPIQPQDTTEPSPASPETASAVQPLPAAPVLELPLPKPPPLPALADAFAAILAAEQDSAASGVSASWPAAPAPAPVAVVTEELVEEVARRVLQRLSDTVVRDAVVDVASRVAERLIREEIERIKASIK